MDRLKWLYRLTDAISRVNDLDEIYRQALLCLRHTLGAERAAVLVFDADGLMRFVAWEGISEHFRAAVEGPSRWAPDAQDAVPILIEDADASADMAPFRELLHSEGIRALGFVPLLYAGRVLGKFMIYYNEPHSFSETDVQMAQIMGSHIAFAVHARRSEAELCRARDELDTILRHITDGVVAVGQDGQLVYANDAAAQIAWQSSGIELSRMSLADIVRDFEVISDRGDPVAEADYPIHIALRTGNVTTATLGLRHRPTGELRWLACTAAPVLKDEARVRFAVSVMRDITQQREMERILRNNEQRMRRAYDAAKAAEQRKDEFLAVLGHELRNPLAPIVTALQLMRMKGSDAFERERTIIDRQVQYMLRLVDDLLDVSRITRGKLQLRCEPVELANIVTKAVEVASPLLEQRGHRLELAVPRTGLRIDVDPIRFAQVIANLLTNAAKYSEPGGTISVTAQREHDMVSLQVRDAGIGIAPELLPHLFDLFYQAPPSQQRATGGLGIGLTIVKRLVELHHGDITAHSEGPGKGSTFTVRVPTATAAQTEGLSHPAHAAAHAQPRLGLRVLVVDDNPDAADTLADTLSNFGCQTAVAYDGPQALGTADAFDTDVAILDIGLPLMDGYELAQRLRHKKGEALTLIALTGYGQEHDRQRARQAGFDVHFVKPIEPQALVATLTSIAAETAAPGG